MAIKGKKKSRGAQGVRRPAAAPRPQVTGARRHTPFYKTRDGLILLGILGAVALGTIVWLVMSAQNEAKELEAQQSALEQYADQVDPVLEPAVAIAEEMGAVLAVPEDPADLTEDSTKWVTDLQGAQTQLSQIIPAPEADPINQLLNEALSLYVSSAETFALVPDADGNLQQELFTRATVQRDTASAVWASAVSAFDELRGVRELGASGLDSPQAPAPVADPLATPGAEEIPHDDNEAPHGAEEPVEIEVPAEGDGAGGDGGDGKKGKGNKGDG